MHRQKTKIVAILGHSSTEREIAGMVKAWGGMNVARLNAAGVPFGHTDGTNMPLVRII